MCIERPGVVVERAGAVAAVSLAGRVRRASTLLVPDLAVGDWVLVAAGTVISRLDPAQAEQLINEVDRVRGEAQ